MVYYSGDMELEVVSQLFHGSVNDAVVCRDLRSAAGAMYTLLVVRDRACARSMLAVMAASDRTGESPCLRQIAQNEELLFLFPYREERKFSAFAKGQLTAPFVGETISVNLVMECLSTGLPWPLLSLVLRQDCVQIAKDHSVYFTYALDLEQLNPDADERTCVSQCTELILDLLGTPAVGKKKPKKLKSYQLIWKKSLKHAYRGFPELYQDIRYSSLPTEKTGVKDRLLGSWHRNKDLLFRVLLVLCTVLLLVAATALITQMIFGEVPWLRLFQHTFDVIGTENLHLGGHI